MTVRDEEASLWELFLHRGDFSSAFRHCRSQVLLCLCASVQFLHLGTFDCEKQRHTLPSRQRAIRTAYVLSHSAYQPVQLSRRCTRYRFPAARRQLTQSAAPCAGPARCSASCRG